jgi:hypothetical protein
MTPSNFQKDFENHCILLDILHCSKLPVMLFYCAVYCFLILFRFNWCSDQNAGMRKNYIFSFSIKQLPFVSDFMNKSKNTVCIVMIINHIL